MRYAFFFAAFAFGAAALAYASIRVRLPFPVVLVLTLLSGTMLGLTIGFNLANGVSLADLIMLKGDITARAPVRLGLLSSVFLVSLCLLIAELVLLFRKK